MAEATPMWSPYMAMNNDPVSIVDPLGLQGQVNQETPVRSSWMNPTPIPMPMVTFGNGKNSGNMINNTPANAPGGMAGWFASLGTSLRNDALGKSYVPAQGKPSGIGAGMSREEIEDMGYIIDVEGNSYFKVHSFNGNGKRVDDVIKSGDGSVEWQPTSTNSSTIPSAGSVGNGQSTLKQVNDWLGYAGYAEAGTGAAQLSMIAYRQSLPIASKIGTFSKFYANYRLIGSFGKGLSGVGYAGALLNTYIDYKAVQSGEISTTRFAYRTTGTIGSIVGSMAVGAEFGGPYGAIGGAFIGAGFNAAEMGYDGYMSWQTQMAEYLTRCENALKGGWMPR